MHIYTTAHFSGLFCFISILNVRLMYATKYALTYLLRRHYRANCACLMCLALSGSRQIDRTDRLQYEQWEVMIAAYDGFLEETERNPRKNLTFSFLSLIVRDTAIGRGQEMRQVMTSDTIFNLYLLQFLMRKLSTNLFIHSHSRKIKLTDRK